jgi:hypothetical protein
MLTNAPLSWFLLAIWTEKRPATSTLINDFSNYIFCSWRNISAGQSLPILAKTTCANHTS